MRRELRLLGVESIDHANPARKYMRLTLARPADDDIPENDAVWSPIVTEDNLTQVVRAFTDDLAVGGPGMRVVDWQRWVGHVVTVITDATDTYVTAWVPLGSEASDYTEERTRLESVMFGKLVDALNATLATPEAHLAADAISIVTGEGSVDVLIRVLRRVSLDLLGRYGEV